MTPRIREFGELASSLQYACKIHPLRWKRGLPRLSELGPMDFVHLRQCQNECVGKSSYVESIKPLVRIRPVAFVIRYRPWLLNQFLFEAMLSRFFSDAAQIHVQRHEMEIVKPFPLEARPTI